MLSPPRELAPPPRGNPGSATDMDARSLRILSEIKTMDPDLFALQVFIKSYDNAGYFCMNPILNTSVISRRSPEK